MYRKKSSEGSGIRKMKGRVHVEDEQQKKMDRQARRMERNAFIRSLILIMKLVKHRI